MRNTRKRTANHRRHRTLVSSSPDRRGERGFTLVEMLIAMSLMLVVVVGPLAWIVTSTTQQNKISSNTFTTRTAEIGLEALARDLHQAYMTPLGTPAANASSVTIVTSGGTTTLSAYLPPTAALPYGQPVSWSCSATAAVPGCTRTQGASVRKFFPGLKQITFAGSAPTGLTPGATAPTSLNPDYISITVTMNQINQLGANRTNTIKNSQPITVQAGADLRGLAS